ncbi:hypothetical protein JQK87_00930 [Streptomyces sp. G44]|nr:hypothetical protein [Streptomyces sp. G44]
MRVDALLTADGKGLDPLKQLKTRLWDVRKGSEVTLTYEYAPTVDRTCPKAGQGAAQQRKELPLEVRIDGKRNESWKVMVPKPEFDTIQTTYGPVEARKTKWDRATVSFKAETDHPEVAFVLPDVQYGETFKYPVMAECHPMIAAVSARQRPIEVDKSRRKSDLPPAKSFTGNEPSMSETLTTTPDPTRALKECAKTTNDCKFTLNQRYSYGYYDRPRPIGEVYENCTFSESQASAALRDKRKVVYRERSFDSANQVAHTQFLDSGSHQGLVKDDLSRDVTHAEPGTSAAKDADQADHGKAAVHFAAAYEKVRDQPWQWSRTAERDIDVVTPKNHASWVEVSAARERADGHYTVTGSDLNGTIEPAVYRQFITYDGPSRITSDRVFQRHGTLSPTEIARCKTHRPLPYTPAEEPVVPYDPKDTDVKDESLTPGTAVSKRNMPPAKK